MGEIETVEAEKMGWLDLPRGASYPTFPYLGVGVENSGPKKTTRVENFWEHVGWIIFM